MFLGFWMEGLGLGIHKGLAHLSQVFFKPYPWLHSQHLPTKTTYLKSQPPAPYKLLTLLFLAELDCLFVAQRYKDSWLLDCYCHQPGCHYNT